MKSNLHPTLNEILIKCSCGSEVKMSSTLSQEILNLELCSKCHPFYTGKHRIVDTAGRVDKFRKKYNLK